MGDFSDLPENTALRASAVAVVILSLVSLMLPDRGATASLIRPAADGRIAGQLFERGTAEAACVITSLGGLEPRRFTTYPSLHPLAGSGTIQTAQAIVAAAAPRGEAVRSVDALRERCASWAAEGAQAQLTVSARLGSDTPEGITAHTLGTWEIVSDGDGRTTRRYWYTDLGSARYVRSCQPCSGGHTSGTITRVQSRTSLGTFQEEECNSRCITHQEYEGIRL